MSQRRDFVKTLGISLGGDRCIVDNQFEIISFESEVEQRLFSVWDDARRIDLSGQRDLINSLTNSKSNNSNNISNNHNVCNASASKQKQTIVSPPKQANVLKPQQAITSTHKQAIVSKSQHAVASNMRHRHDIATTKSGLAPGMTIFVNNVPVKKHKFNKAYNRFKVRSEKTRNVLRKQALFRVNSCLASANINPWTAYIALQALKEPVPVSQKSTGQKASKKSAKSASPTKAQQQAQNQFKFIQLPTIARRTPHATYSQTPALISAMMPLDPSNVIVYSDKLNPSQVAEYRHKAKQPKALNFSKKSSSASYDAYEIMQVLANSTKTNITIARTTKPLPANNPSSSQTSTNESTPPADQSNSSAHNNSNFNAYTYVANPTNKDFGIVSTQLHLQARGYRESLSRYYIEERKKLEEEAKANARADAEEINRFAAIPMNWIQKAAELWKTFKREGDPQTNVEHEVVEPTM